MLESILLEIVEIGLFKFAIIIEDQSGKMIFVEISYAYCGFQELGNVFAIILITN